MRLDVILGLNNKRIGDQKECFQVWNQCQLIIKCIK